MISFGKVASINHDKVRVRINSDVRNNAINHEGKLYYFGNIGSYIKILNSVNEYIICEVVSITSDDMPESESINKQSIAIRHITAKPIGSINNEQKFSVGVTIFPSLYSEVYIIDNNDMRNILSLDFANIEQNKDNEQNGNIIHQDIDIGTSKNLINYPIRLSIDKLFNIHTAILGNSGSGKSNTISTILQKVMKKENYYAHGAKFILYDTNGEYQNAIQETDNITVKYVKPNDSEDSFYMPHFLMNTDEWASFLMASDATQKPFWDLVLQEAYKFYMLLDNNESKFSSNKIINYFKYSIILIVNSILENLLVTQIKSHL